MAGGALSFREDPFRLTPDRRYIFETDGFRRAFAMLVAGVRARRGVLMLTGPSGTGKTTLLQGLLAKLQHDGCVAFWRFHPDIPGYDLIGSCLAELEVNDAPTEPAARARALAKALTSRSATQPAVLIVDEAGQFADAQLAELAALPAATGHTLQVVLAGLPTFADRLNSEALAELRKAVTMRAELGPLDRTELGAYIAHRCRVAGQSGPLVFEAQAIARVFDHTGGTPRLVNRLCATSLFFAAPNSRQISASVVDEAARACNGDTAEAPKEQSTPPEPSATKEQPAVPPSSASPAAAEASDRPVLRESPSEVHRTLAEAERAWIASTAAAPIAAALPAAPAAAAAAAPAEPAAPTVPALLEAAPTTPAIKDKPSVRATAVPPLAAPASVKTVRAAAVPPLAAPASVTTAPAAPETRRRSPALRIAASVVVVAGSAAALGAILWPEMVGRERISDAAPTPAVTQLLVSEDNAAKAASAPTVPIVEATAKPERDATPVAQASEPALSIAMKPVEAATREPAPVVATKIPEPPAAKATPVREPAPAPVVVAPAPEPSVVAAAPAPKEAEPTPVIVTPPPAPEPLAPVAEAVSEPATTVAALSAIEPANGIPPASEATPTPAAPAPAAIAEPPPAPMAAEPVAPPAPKAAEPTASPAPKAPPAAKVAEAVTPPVPPVAPLIIAPEVPKEPAVVALAAPVRETPTVVAVAPPKPAPVPPRAAQAALPAADAVELQQLMGRGDDMLRLGDPASARLFYERAAGRGLARAYTAVGRTFDPSVLQRLGIRGGGANGDQALAWYKRGSDAGDSDATKAADDLNAWLRRR